VSNPPHKPIPPDRFSDGPSSADIPAARRQSADIPLHEIEKASARPPQKGRSRSRHLLIFLLAASSAAVGLWQWNRINPQAPALTAVKQTWKKAVIATGLSNASEAKTADTQSAGNRDTEVPSQSADNPDSNAINQQTTNQQATEQQATAPTATSAEQPDDADTLLNHRRYSEAPQEELVALNANSLLKLQPDAQQSVNAMLTKAKTEGIQLGVISAFRTVEDQNHLYFDIKAERGQSAKTRAEVSAPPGYSEHHTGYAVDFIDEGRPETQLNPTFETTPAFQWLEKNAAFFNFELSFPKDSDSGVSYEPWHWRYVGNQKSLELFYKD